jgi:hypothetical protein
MRLHRYPPFLLRRRTLPEARTSALFRDWAYLGLRRSQIESRKIHFVKNIGQIASDVQQFDHSAVGLSNLTFPGVET